MNTGHITAGSSRLVWFKSSYSGSGGGDCIEVALTSPTVHIRDSKNTTGPVLRVPAHGWRAFVSYAAS